MVGLGAGVMLQARKAEIRARAVEQCQRPRIAHRIVPHAVGNFVTDVRKLVGWEPSGKLGRRHGVQIDSAAVEHIGVRNLASAAPDRNLYAIVGGQVRELGFEIVAEQCWPGDAAGVGTGLCKPCECARQASGRLLAAVADSQFGISETAFGPERGIGMDTLFAVGGERFPEVGDRLVVDGTELIDESGNVAGIHAKVRLAISHLTDKVFMPVKRPATP